jgi:hypothetical protein
MPSHFPALHEMFTRTEQAIHHFMSILEPAIQNAKDEHERLYYHHIYEEEEQRLDRLVALLPKLKEFIKSGEQASIHNREFITLLQDISLEKFGLHNFMEHLELSLFHFKDTEHVDPLQQMRAVTYEDYQAIKQILADLNAEFDGAAERAGSTPTDDKEHVNESLKISFEAAPTQASQFTSEKASKKGLTVGSLKA